MGERKKRERERGGKKDAAWLIETDINCTDYYERYNIIFTCKNELWDGWRRRERIQFVTSWIQQDYHNYHFYWAKDWNVGSSFLPLHKIKYYFQERINPSHIFIPWLITHRKWKREREYKRFFSRGEKVQSIKVCIIPLILWKMSPLSVHENRIIL